MSEDEVTMPFGKYKGEAVSELPDGYLCWLIREDVIESEDLRILVEKEAEDRGLDPWERY